MNLLLLLMTIIAGILAGGMAAMTDFHVVPDHPRWAALFCRRNCAVDLHRGQDDREMAVCGFDADPRERPAPQLRRAPLLVLSLFFVGQGRLRMNGREWPVGQGSLVLRLPDREQDLTLQSVPRYAKAYLCLPPWSQQPLTQLGLLTPEEPVRTVSDLSEAVQAWWSLLQRWQRAAPAGSGAAWADCCHLIQACRAVGADCEDALSRAAHVLAEDLRAEWDLADLAQRCACSYSSFRRQFRQRYGQAPGAWRLRHRQRVALEMLQTRSVQAVAEELGYADAFAFSAQFKRFHGLSPLHYQQTIGGCGSLTSRCSPH